MLYLTNIDLNQNELQNAVLQPLAAAPSNPKLGQIYTNSVSKKVMWYDGTAWKTIGVVVEDSETNGNIKVDGVEMTVYELPKATADTLGGVKKGNGLNIDDDGTLSVDVVDNLTSDDATKPLSAAQGKALKQSIDSITGDIGELGGGDMMKATYDADNDGVVDDAAKLGGQSPDYYAKSENVLKKNVNNEVSSSFMISGQDIKFGYDGTETVSINSQSDPYVGVISLLSYCGKKVFKFSNMEFQQPICINATGDNFSNYKALTIQDDNGYTYFQGGKIDSVTEDFILRVGVHELKFVAGESGKDGVMIKQVQPGTDDTDAVNLSQLNAVQNAIPVKLSDLTNDESFIDNAVDNLVNYYKKTETLTKEEINTLIGNISTIEIQAVGSLPETGSSNVIYLTPKTNAQSQNAKDEWLWTGTAYEKIGDTEIDLSNYLTKTGDGSEVTVAFTQAENRENIAPGEKLSVLMGKLAKAFADLQDVAFSGSYNDLSDTPTIIKSGEFTIETTAITANQTFTGTKILMVDIYDDTTGEKVVCDVTIDGMKVTVDLTSNPTHTLKVVVLYI